MSRRLARRKEVLTISLQHRYNMPGYTHLQHAHCQATLDCDDLPAARRSSSISHACTQRVHCIREGTHLRRTWSRALFRLGSSTKMCPRRLCYASCIVEAGDSAVRFMKTMAFLYDKGHRFGHTRFSFLQYAACERAFRAATMRPIPTYSPHPCNI
jgi:hypothetical protein